MNAILTSTSNRAPNSGGRCFGVRLVAPILLGTGALTGCASQTGYDSAFSVKTTLAGNSHSFNATPDQTFKTVKITLVQQGFTIETADNANGLIKAVRAFEDSKAKKVSYLVTTSMDVTGSPSGDATIVTASAAQQTILHKASEKYYKLLGLVPIPTGKDYQTIVRKEGNITDVGFYNDLFAAVSRNLPKVPVATAVAYPVTDTSAVPPAVPAPSASAAASPPATATASANSTGSPPNLPTVRDMANPFGAPQPTAAPNSANEPLP